MTGLPLVIRIQAISSVFIVMNVCYSMSEKDMAMSEWIWKAMSNMCDVCCDNQEVDDEQ